jgi:intracellular septation protein A
MTDSNAGAPPPVGDADQDVAGRADAASDAGAAVADARSVTLKSLLLGGGPRFSRDAFGPPLAFYLAWKVGGLIPGIATATVVALVAYRYERKHDRPGLMARLSLGFIVVQAVVGLVARSAVVYLAQPVLLSAVFGLAFVGSVAARRPLAGMFAMEIYPFPDEVRASATFRRVFGRVSLVWGIYLLVRSVTRLAALSHGRIEAFLAVNLVTGVPLTAALMSWSIWYGLRGFRRSAEWGWAFEGGESPPGGVPAGPPEEPSALAPTPAPALGRTVAVPAPELH